MTYLGDKSTARTLALLACIGLVLVGRMVFTQTSGVQAARIDAVFESWITSDSPGCACGVMTGGQVIYAKAFGLADLQSREPLSTDSGFDIASMAKQFTAASIVLLADAEAFDVASDIRDYIPEFPDYGVPISVDHLIHHQSGIRDYGALAYFAGRLGDSSLDNPGVIELLVRQKSLNFIPGEQYLYSNSNYVLLAEIVERVTGESFPSFASANIFDPLDMSDTRIRGSGRFDSTDSATGYTVSTDGKFVPSYDSIATYGDGRLISSIVDMANWDKNLQQGAVGGDFLVERMRERGVLGSGAISEYGYGLQFSSYRGLPIEHHGGSTNGFRTQLVRFPSEHVSIAVFCNVATANADLLSLQVADIVLEEVLDPGGQSPFADTEVWIDPESFDRFVGQYSVPGNGGDYIMTISRDGSRYFAQRPGVPLIQIFPSSATEFFARVAPGRFEFHLSESDSVTGVTISQPSGEKRGVPVNTYVQPSDLELQPLVGGYFSPELQVTYEVRIDEGGLAAVGPAGELRLTAKDRDRFSFPGAGSIEFFGELGKVGSGFRLSVERARNVEFERSQ